MDSLPWHPAIVHLPLGLAFLSPLLLASLTLALRKRWVPRQTWAVCVGVQVLLLAVALVAERTGHNEEERVEEIVSERVIHEHEERAEAFIWSAGVTLAVSAGVFVLAAERAAAAAAIATLAALVTLVLAYRTGLSGGELVYKHGAASAYAAPE